MLWREGVSWVLVMKIILNLKQGFLEPLEECNFLDVHKKVSMVTHGLHLQYIWLDLSLSLLVLYILLEGKLQKMVFGIIWGGWDCMKMKKTILHVLGNIK